MNRIYKGNSFLSRPLRKLDTQNQMTVTIYDKSSAYLTRCMVGTKLTTIHLLARFRGISPLLEADKRKPLRSLRISVLGQEDSRHPAKPLKHVAKVLLLCELGDLPVPPS